MPKEIVLLSQITVKLEKNESLISYWNKKLKAINNKFEMTPEILKAKWDA